jgi:hypothetical protein
MWTIYEIDPVVVSLARDPRWFDFLAVCAPDAKIVMGDGRLSLARAPDAAYDLLIIDTFSSDAIPIHMVTREAIAMYFRKLSERGVLMLHISNEYLDLAPILGKNGLGAGPGGPATRAATAGGTRRPLRPAGVEVDGDSAAPGRSRAGSPAKKDGSLPPFPPRCGPGPTTTPISCRR